MKWDHVRMPGSRKLWNRLAPCNWADCLSWIACGAITFAILVFVPPSWIAANYFDPPKRMVWAGLLVVMAGVWLCPRSRAPAFISGLACLLALWIVGRTVFKPYPSAELEVLATWLLPVLAFVLGLQMDQERGLRLLGVALTANAAIQIVLLILQRVGHDPLFADVTAPMVYAPGRMIGTIGYQNHAADALALCGVGLFLLRCRPVFLLGGWFSIVVAMTLSGYRGGLVAAVVALAVSQVAERVRMPSFSAREKLSFLAVSVVAILVVGGLLAVVPEARKRFGESVFHVTKTTSFGTRAFMFHAGVEMVRERPLTGWGAGEYAYQYLDRLREVVPQEKTPFILKRIVFARETHNDVLQFMAEFGVVGLLLVAALLAAGLFAFRRGRRERTDVFGGGVFVVVYMALASVLSFPWQSSVAGPLAGLLLGWLWPRGYDLPAVTGPEGSVPQSLLVRFSCCSKWLVMLLSVGVACWFACDVYLNYAIPARIAGGGAASARQVLPGMFHRYHALVGAAEAREGCYPAAERELTHARNGYRDVLLLNNLAHVYAKQGQWDKARVCYLEWSQTGINYSNALHNLSIACEKTERYEAAVDALSRKLILWPSSGMDEIRRLIVLQIRAGMPNEALATLGGYRNRWQKAPPLVRAEYENMMGAAYRMIGDMSNAVMHLQFAIDLNPSLESARRNLQSMQGSQGK